MLFCPTCGSLLLVEKGTSNFRFYCRMCPYIYYIFNKFTSVTTYERKQVDDVLGGPEAFKDAAQIETVCPKCSHNKAYFFSMQIRSADEPMTTFYKCANPNCGNNWKEG